MRRVGSVALVVGTLLALAACTRPGATTAEPVESAAVMAGAARATPASSASAPAPAPSPAPAAGGASLRAAFGTGCRSVRAPATRYRAAIADVDGDGREDVEWAVAKEGGSIEFGVTTAAGVTIAKTAGFASGGQRSVSIGTLSTGQTVALPTDLHAAPLFVIHDCRWVEPAFPSARRGTDFVTGYSDPPGAGGGCVGRRLYQVESVRTGSGRETVTGVTEQVSADARSVAPGRRVALGGSEDASTPPHLVEQYGDGSCLPSPRLLPVVDR